MDPYNEMLDQGINRIPVTVLKKERFEMPTVEGHIEGNKTIVTNFLQIADILHRDPNHLLKFLLKELATPGLMDNTRLILGRKINSKQINEKIEKYATTYVLCKDCHKPDTRLIREDRILMIKCTACGARHAVPV